MAGVAPSGGHGAAPGRFRLERVRNGDACLLTPAGELDVLTAPRLVTTARDELRHGVVRLTINLSAVTFLDSSGVAALINVLRYAERCRARLTVACPDGPVRQVLVLARVAAPLGLDDASRA